MVTSLRLLHLYPDLLNLYGDRGNIITLKRRCQWRNIELAITEASLGDKVDFANIDLVFMGGGSDREQTLLFQDFKEHKGPALVEATEEGLPLLSVCGGYQLLGQYYKTHDGDEMPGLGLFDAWTEAGESRLIGNVIAQVPMLGGKTTLVGFENHSGRTYLGSSQSTTALAKVLRGHGNNGQDKSEGAVYKNALGTYLHGPILPKNPALADWLLSKALERRFGSSQIDSLPDCWEQKAHQAIIKRFS
ncbi:glutamine amidotransferase [Heliorestis acidaminivorans]|uniref:Lipid II isoglutaminyl synthase (glutamine-hydrolyzing) subunit GatD n=1 Tax=Heliorestis acidaminivorans TaxID=553427 RepID=A0A6I0ERQ2_9FIRM|nr:glutamine amidotransferase [Heliorestis acidaminivorans]KAB2953049.1 glutamine amidotransferase [Heliorestis acidaminivorans]